jgi:peptidoglycan/xylan/chitin deacetylase (PgdA/CDA1 family)
MLRLRARLAVAAGNTGIADLLLSATARLPSSWQRLTVLAWHRVAKGVGPGFDPGVVDATPKQFNRQISILKQHFSLIDIGALLKYREEGRPLPSNPAMLTFDDGYRENVSEVLPILKKHDAKAVFFISTGYMEERKLFVWELIHALTDRCRRPDIHITYPAPAHVVLGDDRARRDAARILLRASRTHLSIDWKRFFVDLTQACEVDWDAEIERQIADELILDWDGVRTLVDAGMDVQSHGHSHSLYPFISEEEVLRDASISRQLLEAHTGLPQVAIAYPAGACFASGHPGSAAVAKAGYKLGFGFDLATRRLRSISDWLRIPRIASEPGMTESQFRGFLAFPNILG